MTEVLGDFIRALRANDVRISAAESIDAARTLELIGYERRELLRAALGQSLAKSAYEKDRFGETFDRFFQFDVPPKDSAETPEPDTDNSASDAKAESLDLSDGTGTDAQPSLMQMLMENDTAGLAMAMAAAARDVRLNDIVFFTQRGLYSMRMLDAMGIEAVEQSIDQLRASSRPDDQTSAQTLSDRRDQLRQEVRDYIEKQMSLFTANAGRKLREEMLAASRLREIDHRDMRLMHGLVQRMAKKLVALHSRRKRIARRGQLDIRRTIRANIEFDGIPFHTIWRRTKVDRPKVIAVCDVSGSVARVSQFLLMFLYSLQDILPDVRSFAFSGQLFEVTDLFATLSVEAALPEVMDRCGGGSTDYGRAFQDLEKLALSDVDHRTTILILGDARSNNTDPGADILKRFHDKVRRIIWLNPEQRTLWDSGDSVMRRLKPHCDRAITCASLSDLERVVSDLLRTAV
jgi:uncharacterized protein with von Willebrand factor type A (vWA) domain